MAYLCSLVMILIDLWRILSPASSEPAYQSAYQPVRPPGGLSERPRTVRALDCRSVSAAAVDGMEEVRGSSPLSSTQKVLVRAHLILRDV
jgi:hypothetical protein